VQKALVAKHANSSLLQKFQYFLKPVGNQRSGEQAASRYFGRGMTLN
jgi:hypothetical protein